MIVFEQMKLVESHLQTLRNKVDSQNQNQDDKVAPGEVANESDTSKMVASFYLFLESMGLNEETISKEFKKKPKEEQFKILKEVQDNYYKKRGFSKPISKIPSRSKLDWEEEMEKMEKLNMK